MSRIGFFGAGVMGGPMIANLVRAAHTVQALGRSKASKQRIADAGAAEVDDIAGAIDGADVVITMLPDTPDVRSLVFDPGGLASRMRPGQVFVDMSTIAPATSREIYAALAATDVAALDAPVSGGEQAAVDGSLSIMVGGEAVTLTSVRPVLETIGNTVTHVGPAGSGQLTKAANQLIVAANLQAVSEAVVFLSSAGVDLYSALTAINNGLAGSTVLTRKRSAFLEKNFAPGFRVTLHDKDLGIVMQTMREQGNALPVTAVVAQLMAALKARGGGDLDHSALLDLTRMLNGQP